ncbi:MAG: hypothetical protein ACO20H_04360 [Bacteriovoracaceae bacterium]
MRVLFFYFIIIFSVTAQDEAGGDKYPQIKEVLNNPQLGDEGKCPAECQAKQLDCYKDADGPKRDKCADENNKCMAECGGVIGDSIDPEILKNPSSILDGLDVDPELIQQVINTTEGRGVDIPTNQNAVPNNAAPAEGSSSPFGAPPPSSSSPVGTPPPSASDPI